MMRDNHGAVRLMRHAGGTVRPVGLDDHSAEFELTLTDRSAVENQVDVGNLAPLT
jgi:hypothetical protein